MKKIFYSAFITLLLTVIAGCTHNDGDIGHWFGSWLLEEVSVDGTAIRPDPQVMISFQGDIFDAAEVGGQDFYGMWNEENSRLSLAGDPHSGGPAVFPAAFRFGEELNVTVDVLSQDAKSMTWRWTDPRGRTILYTFRHL